MTCLFFLFFSLTFFLFIYIHLHFYQDHVLFYRCSPQFSPYFAQPLSDGKRYTLAHSIASDFPSRFNEDCRRQKHFHEIWFDFFKHEILIEIDKHLIILKGTESSSFVRIHIQFSCVEQWPVTIVWIALNFMRSIFQTNNWMGLQKQ